MRYEDIPSEPSKRETIVILEGYELEFARLDKSNKWIESPNICVLGYPFSSDSPVCANKLYPFLYNKKLLKDGNILVQNPFNLNEYKDAKDIYGLLQSNAFEKLSIFSSICRELGATKIVVKHNESNESNSQKNIKAGIPIPSGQGISLGGVDVDINKELENKIMQKIYLLDTFDGMAEPNIESAKKILKEKNLTYDEILNGLIEGRNSKNKITSRSVRLEFIEDSMKSLNIAASVNYERFNAKGEYSSKIKSVKNLVIDFKVEFGKG